MGFTTLEELLKSILGLFRSSSSDGSITATQSLTGTATALTSTVNCKAVILLSAVTVTTGGGTAVSLTSPLTLPCNYPSDILVSGSGTLSYIILV
jgi:hypothetical protein